MFGETADQQRGFLNHAGSHSNVDDLSPRFQCKDCQPSVTEIRNRTYQRGPSGDRQDECRTIRLELGRWCPSTIGSWTGKIGLSVNHSHLGHTAAKRVNRKAAVERHTALRQNWAVSKLDVASKVNEEKKRPFVPDYLGANALHSKLARYMTRNCRSTR